MEILPTQQAQQLQEELHSKVDFLSLAQGRAKIQKTRQLKAMVLQLVYSC